jgi:DNA-binding NarL/FixJ family response regulator
MRIIIADDHELFRQGLRFALADGFDGAEVIEVDGLDPALEQLAGNGDVDLLIVDLDMPGMEGPNSLRTIREAFPGIRVAVVSASQSRDDILAALSAGAHGFIPKVLPSNQIVDALGSVMKGGIYVPASIAALGVAAAAAQPMERPPAPGAGVERLTPRQRDVLAQLAKGLPTKSIAAALGLSEGTVKVHLAGIYRALGAKSRMDAVLRASKLYPPEG